MWIFKTFVTSIAEPKKYKSLIKLPTKKILGYFVAWMTILGIGLGLYTQFSEIPKLKIELEKSKELLVVSFPEDLIITWDQEKLTTNPEKYHQSIFTTTANPYGEQLFFEYQNTQLDINELSVTENLKIMVDQTKIYVSNPEGWTDIELKEFFTEELEINHSNIGEKAEVVYQGLLNSLDKSLPYLYIFFILLMIVSRLIVSLFYGLMMMLLGKILGWPKNWSESWKFSTLVVVLAEIINQIANLTYKTLDVPMFSLSFWLITIYVLFVNLKKPSINT